MFQKIDIFDLEIERVDQFF